MADQDFQDLFSYLQPQNLAEDPEFFGSSMEEGFPTNMLDTQESHSGRIPAPWESEADSQLLDEPAPDLFRGMYQDFDTSADKGKGRAVEEQSDLDEHDNESGYHPDQSSLREATFANPSPYRYQDASSSYGTALEHHSQYQSDYASLGYVHAGSEQSQFYGENPASSALSPNQASSSASAFTAAGQISSRSIRRARKPAAQSTAPPKEKKPVKQSKKKSLAEVRDSQSGLLWRPSPDLRWIPAVYHNDIWNELLQWTDQVAATQGGYDHPPAKGIEHWNRTAFCLAQKSWARVREYRPAVLFYIQKTDVADPPKPQDFFWNKRRVIDRDNLGMRWFDDLPATISSAVEDFRLDAIQKLNPNIEWEDIWGRTPNEFRTGKEPGVRTRTALTVPALSNRTLRFRREAGTLAWDRKDEIGNEIASEFFENLMGEDCIKDNNTYAFGRDLRPEEVDRLDEYLRVEKLPERAQARRLRAAARAAAQTQAPAGLSNRQNVQQAPSVYHNAQQPALKVQPPQASIQQVLQPSANGSSQSYPREPPAQSGRTGQGSSSSRFGASRFRQGFGASVPSTSAFNPTNPAYGAPNQHGKRSFDDTHEDRQSAATAKRPRVIDPESIDQVTPDFTRDSEHPRLLQPRLFNPLKRSNVLSPNGMARGAQIQAFSNNAAPRSANNTHLGGHTDNINHKRDREESDDDEEERTGMQYKKPRIQQASVSQSPSSRQTRCPARRPWRPSQALARSVGARIGTRAPHGPLSSFGSDIRPTNEPRASGRESYTAEAVSANVALAPNNGYMDIQVSVPIGSEVIVKPRAQTYNLVGTAIPGQNIEWKVVDRLASAASHDAEDPMPSAERDEGDPDWQGHRTTARSSNRMANDHLPRKIKAASNNDNLNPVVEDIGPPPGLPEDFVEEGFEPDGYEDTVQYQDQRQTENLDLSSSTVGGPCDYEASASSPIFGGNLAGTPYIDYFSQFNIPHYSAEELDDILGEAADNTNSSSTIDPNAHADQAPTEIFAIPQADTSGVLASGFDDIKYEQMQADYQDTFGRPLFDPNYPVGDDILDPTSYVDFPLDYPLPPAAEAEVPQITRPSMSGEEVRVVCNDGGIQGQPASSSPTLGAASGSPKAQQETPGTTIPSDPVRAPEAPSDSDPPAAPQGSEPQETDWDELFGEDYDKEYVEEEL